jgi:hypothetical protein
MNKRRWLIFSTIFLLIISTGILYREFASSKYDQLPILLAAGNWEKADRETSHIILKVSGRWLGDWFDLLGYENSLKHFSCKDLLTIDRLWVKYSQGHFGLSVQQRIFEGLDVANFKEDWFKVYDAFIDAVGWQGWPNSQLTYNLTAPQGHLPSYHWMMEAGGQGKTIPWIENGIYLYQRGEFCQL